MYGIVVSTFCFAKSYVSVPLMAEIQLKLLETGVQQGNLSGAVAILTEGLAIE